MKKIKITLIAFVALMGIMTFTPATIAAASPASQIQSGSNAVGGSGATPLSSVIKTVVNVLLYILGAIAVVMIVLGGIRYTTSNGDSSAISGAKNTILYSVIGLIVAIMAYAIVNFVLSSFGA